MMMAAMMLMAGAVVIGASAAWPWLIILTLAGSTFVSEDLTCIAAGQLVQAGELAFAPAIAGCMVGIAGGDIGLFLIGRTVGRSALRSRWVQRRISPAQMARIGERFNRHVVPAVFLARFVPGLRLPTFLIAGILGQRACRFMFVACAAALIWTPLLVGIAALARSQFSEHIERYLGNGWIVSVVVATVLLGTLHSLAKLLSPIGRAKAAAKIAKLWRWEFWPAWLFYPPVVIWIGYLSLRYRGFQTITAANPGIRHSGIVGESKSDILENLRSPHVIQSAYVSCGDAPARIADFRRIITERRLDFPLILKPDVGQRGGGVRLVVNLADAEAHLANTEYKVQIQPFHPGPFEAGIFYFRYPSERRGRILSVTDKVFPVIVGDGVSSLEELIWRHPRFRFQAPTFLARHSTRKDWIPAHNEPFELAVAGNHCQGTEFRDGAHLITAELTATIDEIAQTFPGFFFGRFDVRYSNVDRFKAGKDLTIIELNGATSESTNIYDPSWTLLRAYSVIFQQWRILFEIGRENRERGSTVSSPRTLLRDVLAYYRDNRVTALAD
jgi:membrane protein DedA with SNARE-associated domain